MEETKVEPKKSGRRQYPCELCNVSFGSVPLLTKHINSKTHTRRVQREHDKKNAWIFNDEGEIIADIEPADTTST